jgi:hypothetical protein
MPLSENTGVPGTDNLNTEVNLKSAKAKEINAQTGTAYTLVLADADKIVTMTNAGASTLTVPQNSDAAIPIGSIVEVTQLGAGLVTLAAGTGATIVSKGGALKMAQNATVRLRKISTNGWAASGDIIP